MLVPCFGRLALHGTGSEHDLYRYIVPIFVGGLAGYFIGFMKDKWLVINKDLKATNEVLKQEIEERKQAEESLRAALAETRRFRKALDEVSAHIYMKDTQSRYIYANRLTLELFGCSAEELVGRDDTHFFPLDTVKCLREVDLRVFAGEQTFEEIEVANAGSERRVYWEIKTPIYAGSEHKTIWGLLGISTDITERKRAEEALQQRTYALGERVKELNCLYGISNLVEKPDISLEEIFQGVVDLIPPSWQYPEITCSRIILENKEYKTENFKETNWKQSSEIFGTSKRMGVLEICYLEEKPEINEGPFLKEERKLIDAITKRLGHIIERMQARGEKERLEDQLQKAQKMEAMGLMAGGVAHDLNNILSGIVSYPELLLMDLPEDSPLRKPIKTIQESGMRAADVVEDLLTIARGVATGKEALNLNTLIAEYLGSAEYQKLEKTHSFIRCRNELDPDLLNMSGSSTHIKKILMNLVANASEAIEGSGTVTISTANRYLDEPLKGYEDVRIGEYAVLTVSDDGSGISPEDIEKVFEPFYTKKVMGRSGTGLGLAVVWNTVQDHNGYIDVKSSEKGTVFELYFPVTREQVADEREQVPLDDYLGRGEKILVVDDEERQREIATGILTRLGYTAEAVSSGEDAIEYVKEHPVDLIVLDMVMPKGINGRKTYEEIIKIRPGQKAIIASGYAKTLEVDFAQAAGAGKYIKKPYTLEKVGLAVKEELEK